MADPRSSKAITWQLQIVPGRILGPLTTEEILFRIREGLLTGEEKVRKAPEGEWLVVSREPLFYDELLKALERSVSDVMKPPKPKAPPVKPESMIIDFEETQLPSPRPDDLPLEEPEDLDRTEIYVPQKASPPPQNTSPLVPLSQRIEQQKTFHLPHIPSPAAEVPADPQPIQSWEKTKPAATKQKKKPENAFLKLVRFGIFAGLLVIGAAYWLISKSPSKTDLKFGLILPKVSLKTTLSTAEQTKMEKQIFELIFKDTPDDYFKAEVLTAQLITGAPNLSDPRGLLCIEQLHLWPMVAQNSNDYNIIQSARQSARMLDPRGLDGLHCEVSYLMMMGKYKEALGIIDHTANLRELPDSPVLYAVKSEVLAAERNFAQSLIWAREAQKLWPNWIFPYMQEAHAFVGLSDYASASQSYAQILRMNPKHQAALVEYGNLLYQHGQDLDSAQKLILQAINTNARLTHTNEAQAHLTLAKIDETKGNRSQALIHAQRAFVLASGDTKIRDYFIHLGGNPSSVEVLPDNELVFNGDQYFRSGDYLFAQAEYKTAFEHDPHNALAAIKAAKSLWLLSQTSEAIAWVNKAIKADPKLSLSYYLAADYYSQTFNFISASEVLTQGSQRIPNNPEILRGFGLVELRRNNAKDAVVYFEKAFKLYDNDEDTLVLLSQALLLQGTQEDLQKALNMATRAIQVEDTNPDAQVIYAKVLATTKGPDQGIQYMKEIVAKYSYTPEFRLGLAEIYKSAERLGPAQEEYEKLLGLDPKNKKALMGLGSVLQAQGILDQALKKYLAAAILDPADPEPLFQSGLVYMEAGRYKDAISEFQRGVAASPNYPRGHYFIGKAAFAMRDYKTALASAQLEARNNPDLADPYILAGEIYYAQNDYANCSSQYQQAVKRRSRGAENYVKLALCQEFSGNLDIAESMLTIALTQESGYAEIYKVQGNIFEKKSDTAAAIQAYQKYLLLAPNATDRKDIEKRILNLGGTLE